MAEIYAPTNWIDYSADSTVTGWSSFTNKYIYYAICGDVCFVMFHISGTSNSATTNFSLPYNSGFDFVAYSLNVAIINNGTTSNTPGGVKVGAGSPTVVVVRDHAESAWTASGTKSIRGMLMLKITL